MAAYALTANPNIVTHTATGSSIPADPANRDWQQYQQWLATGGVPDPAPAPPVKYINEDQVRVYLRTTTGTAQEVYRITTQVDHLYIAQLRMVAIDAASKDSKMQEALMFFKRANGGLSQVGSTYSPYLMQDTAASAWRIQPSVDGTSLVISITGAPTRTIDWMLTGTVENYAPAGV
jgi:hypothetical protein